MSTDTTELPEATSELFGFRRHEFDVESHTATVLAPRSELPGRPWAWKGEFLEAFPATEIALLEGGFHIVYLRAPDLFGNQTAVHLWNALYAVLIDRYGFARRPALIGLSRGGLYCYSWAATNPDKVACIYADAPVCDIKSWPGGLGKATRVNREWRLLFQAYGFLDEEDVLQFRGNPVDRLQPLAAADVPLLHVVGDADEIVPCEENTGLLAERYRQLGGTIELIRKPGVGHHPHGLDDPTPIVQFIKQHTH